MKSFERRFKSTLGSRFHAPDLKRRREKMKEHAFVFLRGTCWRWAQEAGKLCPDLMEWTAVPSVGDAHAGNFALWRDA